METSNFFGVRKSGFKPLGEDDIDSVERNAGLNGLIVRKGAAGEAELGLSGQVVHRTGDGSVSDLAARLSQVARRILAPTHGRTLSLDEKRAIRDQIVAAWSKERGSPFEQEPNATPALIELVSLLVGLPNELAPAPAKSDAGADLAKSADTVTVECPYCHGASEVKKQMSFGMERIRCSHCSKMWEANLEIIASARLAKSESRADVRAFIAQTRTQIEDLTKRIVDLLNRRTAASSFRASPTEASFRRNINKALANPIPGDAQGHDLKESTSRFKPQ